MLQFLSIAMPAMVAGLGCFAAAVLFSRRAPWHGKARGLAVFMLVTAVAALDDVVLATGVQFNVPHLLGLSWPLAMLKGPAIFAYVRTMTSPAAPASTRSQWLLLGWPLLLGVVLTTPFYVLSGSEKIGFVARGEAALFADHSLPAIGVLGVIGGALLISLSYLIAAFRYLVRHTRRVRDLFSNIEDKTLSWARWVLLILSVAWVWGAAKSSGSVLGIAPAGQEAVASVLELAWVGALGYFGVLQLPMFETKAAEPEPAARYARSALDADRMDRIAAKLHRAMSEEKLYADPSLSLRQLSDRLGASENYISQTLNERLGRNFFDFVNAARIDEAKRMLRETDRPVLEIAMTVGFNSRSTFNAAFKKHVGSSPSAFRTAPGPLSGAGTSDPARSDVPS